METIILNVEGMSCGHCVEAVTNAIKNIDGVSDVLVSLEEKTAKITYNSSKVDVSNFKEAIEDQGFDVL